MPQSAQSPERWTPGSTFDRELVQKELDSILASYHFRGSKRYPAFLKYVVAATLDGRTSDLKERTLGVEVFGRHPDYDTNADPVVRFSASEVRKRIAQYYHENGNGARLHIELPLGSYVPEFLWLGPRALKKNANLEPAKSASLPSRILSRSWVRILLISLAAISVAAAAFAAYSYHLRALKNATVSARLWAPLVNSPRPVLIVLGTGHRRVTPEADDTSFLNHMNGPYHHVSVATATALANMATALRQYGASYEIKEDAETSLTDLRSRPVILIGATNNAWTMRLVDPLRFQFLPGPMAQVKDVKNPSNSAWTIDFSKPYSSIPSDYAIVARYHDTTTEGPVMVIAGLGPYGTQAASDFVVTPQYLDQILRQVPAGWESKNIEIVIKTELIDGKAGPPALLSSALW